MTMATHVVGTQRPRRQQKPASTASTTTATSNAESPQTCTLPHRHHYYHRRRALDYILHATDFGSADHTGENSACTRARVDTRQPPTVWRRNGASDDDVPEHRHSTAAFVNCSEHTRRSSACSLGIQHAAWTTHEELDGSRRNNYSADDDGSYQ